MTKIESLLPYVMPYAPGLSEPMAIMHIREAARRFCERTRCWRQVDKFEIGCCNQDQIVLAIPEDSEFFELDWAKFDGNLLIPSNPDILDDSCASPKYITQVSPNTLCLHPKSDQIGGEIHISYYLKPDIFSKKIPDFLFNQFGSIIAHGALASALLIPNQPFTNPNLALVFEDKFSEALNRNFHLNLRGQQRAAVRTKPKYF